MATTCTQFSRYLEGVVGDAQLAPFTTSSARHLERCASCRRRWARAQQLVRVRDADAAERVPVGALRRARRRLQQELEQIGRPAIRFDSIRTPVGLVFVGVSERGVCDVTVDETSAERYRVRLAEWATDVQRDPRAVAPALDEIDSYFSGQRTRFSVPVDLRRASGFTSRVLRATRQIPFGRVESYGDIARRIGSPGASRAVGGALGRNPVPIIVPCHRVIARARRLGGFSGGLVVKSALLQLEGHSVGSGSESRDRPTAGGLGLRVVDRDALVG